ncbi:MAG: DUF192 domain-containing protein [Eubacteriales bacterium]
MVYNRVRKAVSFYKRFKGLMWEKQLEMDEGLWIARCNQVHMFNMRFPLDIIYLDKQFRVVKIETLRPRQVGKLVRGARSVLEVTAGSATANGIVPGDYLELKE